MSTSGSDKRRAKASPTEPGEHPRAGVAGTALVTGDTFAVKALNYADVDGIAMFEGDIALGQVADVEAANDAIRAALDPDTQAAVAVVGKRWPGGRIPYTIVAAMPNQQRVTDAIAHWQATTRITFVVRTTEADYVEFFQGSGCWSQVGRQGGKQQISLGSGCSTGNAIHEIGHTVGLWHEQSREDRDSFVSVQWANIQAGQEHNFNQHIADGDDIGSYDYGSIMHYPRDAFSKNGKPTLVPVQAGAVIGQRSGLSAGDIAAIEVMYPDLYPKGTTLFKKIRDDGPVVKVRADVPVKKLRDDLPPMKKVRDDQNVKKILDDNRFSKQIRDEMVVKPVGDVVVGPGPGPLITPRLPFGLQTGHQDPTAAALAAETASTSSVLDTVAAYDAQIEQATDGLLVLAAQLGQLRAEREAILGGPSGAGM